MVLQSKQTTVAYRCPHCGTGVMSAVSPFVLRGTMVRLKCACGRSYMEIAAAGEGKMRFTAPCLFCPSPHRFTVSESIFWGKDLFVLPCPYTDMNIAMMGEVNHVKAELSRSELELMQLMEEHGVDGFLTGEDDACGAFSDPQVVEVVRFVVEDLKEEGKIVCACAEGESEIESEIYPTGVYVRCSRCGREKLIPTGSLSEANDFLHCDQLILEGENDQK